MTSLRSQETLQKEYDLQAEYTTRINLALSEDPGPEYRETLEDVAVFANVLRKHAPEGTLVITHPRPEVIFMGEGDGYKVSLYMTPNCWRFKVNESVHYELDTEHKIGPSRMLKKIWDVVISNLPENYIVRGVVDPKDPAEETEARTKIQQGLGFGLPQINNQVYGVVRDKKLHPLTLEEFNTLTGETADSLHQKFNVRSINWPGV